MSLQTGPEIFDPASSEWARQLILQLRYNIPAGAHDHIAEIIGAFLNRHLAFSPPPGDDAAAEDVNSLRENGFCRLGTVLSIPQIEEVTTFLDDLPLAPNWSEGTPSFARADVPADVNVAHHAPSAVLVAPYLRDVALSPRIVHRVSRYLGAPPTIPFLDAWWSFKGRDAPREAQLFHRDFHDFKWLKLFVYLTDVDAGSGPHVMVRGTHKAGFGQDQLRRIADRDPARAKQLEAAFARGSRVSDGDVEALFEREGIIALEGRAGEAFLVDTSAYHKGLLPRSRDRLVFQALYTLLPTVTDLVNPVRVPDAYARYAAAAGDKAMSPAFWRYCMRLVLNDPNVRAVD